MSNQKVIDKGIKLCQLIDYARHRSRIPGARRVWPCNLTLQRPAWYGSFPPTQDWSYPKLSERDGQLMKIESFDGECPQDLFGPIARAAAELLVDTDLSRVRQCENCILHFYDTSKNASRRWCSMHLCGNRVKVAAYAQRR